MTLDIQVQLTNTLTRVRATLLRGCTPMQHKGLQVDCNVHKQHSTLQYTREDHILAH
jgi:hypothetical protein